MRQILARFFISILFVMALSAATASTYVMMPDEALFDGADIIAYGRIEESLPAAGDQARHVDYRFRIDELVKGFVNWPEQTVRVLGGGQPGDTGLWISDAPRFASGDHTLLFLSRGRDGILRPF